MELKVNQLDRNTDGDIVQTIHWSAIKQDGEFTASSYGSVGVEVGDTVIPFASLTEEVARKDVPVGVPYKIINHTDLPEDQTFFNAWEADFSNPDGYGIGAEAWFAEQTTN